MVPKALKHATLQQIYHFYGGWRKYNLERQIKAELRRSALCEYLLEGVSKTECAHQLGVSRSTITRDWRRLIALAEQRGSCPVCGHFLRQWLEKDKEK